ncbi:MAG: cyclase family protein [Planctomycetia bacterium]|nr:cyclase family protein [Planctomycetia bacterium]
MFANRRFAFLLFLLAGLTAAGIFRDSPLAHDAGGDEAPPAAPTLDQLASGRLPVVDLGWPLNDTSPYWPAENYLPFRLTTIATLEKNGVLSKAFYCPEHLGTHLDAPNHFEKNQPAVDQIDPAQLFARGVKIDVTMQADADADYRLTRADIDEWEKSHGRIPDGVVVLLETGWSRHWNNYPRYKNQDTTGKLHFPGYSAEAAKFLVVERKAKGLGIDTLSIDHGPSKDFVVHHIVNGAGRYGLENLARLDKLPAKGFFLVAAPIKIETGSGGPARVFAIVPGPAGRN